MTSQTPRLPQVCIDLTTLPTPLHSRPGEDQIGWTIFDAAAEAAKEVITECDHDRSPHVQLQYLHLSFHCRGHQPGCILKLGYEIKLLIHGAEHTLNGTCEHELLYASDKPSRELRSIVAGLITAQAA